MRIRIGCRFVHDATSATPAVVLAEPHERGPRTGRGGAAGASEPDLPSSTYVDVYGNRCRRLELPEGTSTVSYDGLVEIDPEPEPTPGPDDPQHRIEDLPDHLLHWLLPSRYAESDLLNDTAWELFGETEPGAERVLAVTSWIHENVEYGVASLPTTSTVEIFERRGGMCRDMAHLGVTFCRALGIPARYTCGYMPDIGVSGPFPADGLPRLVRGLAGRALVDARRPLQHAPDRTGPDRPRPRRGRRRDDHDLRRRYADRDDRVGGRIGRGGAARWSMRHSTT